MRGAYALGFLACCGLLAFAYYAQFALYLDPCPLCIFQRIAFMVMGGLFLLGALHNPAGWGARSYALLLAATGLGGAAIAARHVQLQNLPPDQVPDCGPGLGYMLDNLPLTEALQRAFTGSGECADVSWSFLGMSMPAWTLIWYLALALLALVAGWRSTRRRIFLDS